MNGTETVGISTDAKLTFYSSVILNGTETSFLIILATRSFYSSVILNGTETPEDADGAATQF